MIYFVACHEASAVKIGITRNNINCLYSRVSTMQSGCPFALEVVAIDETGHRSEELDLHLRFAAARIRGEWFRLTDELREHISKFPKPHMPRRKPGFPPRTDLRAASSRGKVAPDFPTGATPEHNRDATSIALEP